MNSRRYTCQLNLWLEPAQAQRLKRLVKRSGLSTQAYLRHLIDGVVPVDRPPPDYFLMTRELFAIGNNLNQIAQRAHATGLINEGAYRQDVSRLDEAIARITEAVTSPREQS
jgi:hypothetical protein